MDKQSLIDLLNKYNVPIVTWGQGGSKSIEHLLDEINSGESKLEENENGLLRSVTGIAVNVFYEFDDGILKLVEEKQVFHDGRSRVRELDNSVGEKVRPGESPIIAAKRALAEELEIVEKLEFINYRFEEMAPIKSLKGSYPGLNTKRRFHFFDVYLTESCFQKEGYVEIQSDKKTFFVWRRIR